jgi:hypothetical protein
MSSRDDPVARGGRTGQLYSAPLIAVRCAAQSSPLLGVMTNVTSPAALVPPREARTGVARLQPGSEPGAAFWGIPPSFSEGPGLTIFLLQEEEHTFEAFAFVWVTDEYAFAQSGIKVQVQTDTDGYVKLIEVGRGEWEARAQRCSGTPNEIPCAWTLLVEFRKSVTTEDTRELREWLLGGEVWRDADSRPPAVRRGTKHL